jgi:hypothetical protein
MRLEEESGVSEKYASESVEAGRQDYPSFKAMAGETND